MRGHSSRLSVAIDRPFGEFWDEDLELGDDEEGYMGNNG